jgi:hypothetical protein
MNTARIPGLGANHLRFVGAFLLLCGAYIGEAGWELAASNVCYSSTGFVDNTFYAPSEGRIGGVKYVFKSGSVTCNTGTTATNWGCNIDDFGVFLIRDDASLPAFTYYPTETTDGVSQITLSGADSSRCTGDWFKFNDDAGVTASDPELVLMDETASYFITAEDPFSVQYGEGCTGHTISDNGGTACVDVYFYYVDCASFEYCSADLASDVAAVTADVAANSGDISTITNNVATNTADLAAINARIDAIVATLQDVQNASPVLDYHGVDGGDTNWWLVALLLVNINVIVIAVCIGVMCACGKVPKYQPVKAEAFDFEK